MDPLNWILLTWLGIAGFVFFALQKLIENWPEVAARSSTDSVEQRSGAPPLSEAKHRTSHHNTAVPSAEPEIRHRNVLPSAASAASSFFSSVVGSVSRSDSKSNCDSAWLNQFLSWIFVQYKGVPECISVWIRSLNDAAKKVSNSVGCEVLFEELVEDGASPPQITNLRAELGPRDHLTLRGSVFCPKVTLRLVSSQRLPDRLLVSNYDVTLIDFKGDAQIRVACIANELFVMGCFDGRPELKVEMINTDSNLTEQVDPLCVEEAIKRCLMSAVTNISFNNVSGTQHGDTLPAHHGARSSNVDMPQPVEEVFRRLNTAPAHAAMVGGDKIRGNKLLVKVLRAQKIGGNQGASQPFVVVEMDEPIQKHTTTLSLSVSPYWDEHFIFDLNERSEEILFEVYDRAQNGAEPAFLGLAIVGIEELRHASATVHTLTLQSRPYKNDPVSGNLVVEFLFYDAPDVGVGADVGKIVSTKREELNAGVITHAQAMSRRPLLTPGTYQDPDSGNIVTPVKTTTVLVKSVSQYFQTPAGEEYGDGGIGISDRSEERKAKSASAVPEVEAAGPAENNLQTHAPLRLDQNNGGLKSVQSDFERGRAPTRRTTSFFKDLGDRLSFRGKKQKKPKRALSVEAPSEPLPLGPEDSTYHPPRSVSTPPSRDASSTRYSGTTRSRSPAMMSSGSAASSESIYQQSTLVIEVTQNNVKKYYLIPPNMIRHTQSKKLMRKGRKLHVFNEHTFVAAHVHNGTLCHACNKTIPRSIGKQAYQCRDCRFTCHKRCHFKTDTRCLSSTVSNLEIESFEYKCGDVNILVLPDRIFEIKNGQD